MAKALAKLTSSKGVSLVEVLVVAAILGVVVMAVMSLFIPAVQSTAVQNDVTDVQSNLRLAIDRMTDDLLTAGFLAGTELPIIFEGSITPTTADNPDSDDFTIQTVLVSQGFARTASASGSSLVLEDADMLEMFAVGSVLRLFNPINATEIETGQAYEVTGIDSDTKTLTIDPALAVTIDPATADDLVLVRVKDGATPLLQKIRYRLENGALTRTVNDDPQFLARGIESVAFAYEFASAKRVRKVDITLTGKTPERVTNGVASEKTRELRTSVTLRNIF